MPAPLPLSPAEIAAIGLGDPAPSAVLDLDASGTLAALLAATVEILADRAPRPMALESFADYADRVGDFLNEALGAGDEDDRAALGPVLDSVGLVLEQGRVGLARLHRDMLAAVAVAATENAGDLAFCSHRGTVDLSKAAGDASRAWLAAVLGAA